MANGPFIGPTYPLKSKPASVQRTINMMPVPLEPGNERTGWVFKDVEGYSAITLTPNIVAAFSSVVTGPSVAFTDLSALAPVSWAWTFGDAGTSTLQNPTHSYASHGTYTVTLTATNSAGLHSTVSHQVTTTTDAAATFGTGQLFSLAVAGDTLALTNSNLTGTFHGSGGWQQARISDSGNNQSYTLASKRYFEVVLSGGPSNYCGLAVGFIDNNATYNTQKNPFAIPAFVGMSCNQAGLSPGLIVNGSETPSALYAAADGAVVGVAINGVNGNVYFSLNGVWIGTQNPSTDANPATTLSALTFTALLTTHDNGHGQTPAFTVRLGADIAYTPPTGYKPWNQTN